MPPAIKTEMPLTVLVFNALIINTHTHVNNHNDTSTLTVLILKSLIAHFTHMHTHRLKVSLMAHFDIHYPQPCVPFPRPLKVWKAITNLCSWLILTNYKWIMSHSYKHENLKKYSRFWYLFKHLSKTLWVEQTCLLSRLGCVLMTIFINAFVWSYLL